MVPQNLTIRNASVFLEECQLHRRFCHWCPWLSYVSQSPLSAPHTLHTFNIYEFRGNSEPRSLFKGKAIIRIYNSGTFLFEDRFVRCFWVTTVFPSTGNLLTAWLLLTEARVVTQSYETWNQEAF